MTRLAITIISLTAIVFILAEQSHAKIDPETILSIWRLDENQGGVELEIRLKMIVTERSQVVSKR